MVSVSPLADKLGEGAVTNLGNRERRLGQVRIYVVLVSHPVVKLGEGEGNK